ncbi:hypothetical protein HY837_00100 [archaeon]|nr:hypothetical protein [archaeon]
MTKDRVIDVEMHAFFRMIERGAQLGLDYLETKNRAFQTIKNGKKSNRKHLSRNHFTYYFYFNDNLSFYVICQERENRLFTNILIKTVIIEYGRE